MAYHPHYLPKSKISDCKGFLERIIGLFYFFFGVSNMVTTAILIIIYDCSLQSYHFLVHYVLDNIFVSDGLLCILLFHLIVTTML